MGLEYSVFCVPPLPKQNLQSCDSVENESLNIFELSLKNPWIVPETKKKSDVCMNHVCILIQDENNTLIKVEGASLRM